MDQMRMFLRASRFYVLPAILIPVILGSVAAYTWTGEFHPVLLLITLLGSAAAHLFSNMINDLWDYRNGVDDAAKETAQAISTNSGFLTKGIYSEKKFAFYTWLLFFVALLCGIALAVATDALVLIFAVLGALIAYFYVAPPIKFGYRGKGYSEIGIFLAFGAIPVMGSYYVQAGHINWEVFLISCPVGILTTLILFNHHFLHWRADEASGKRTLVVVWGEERALKFSMALAILAYVTLIAGVLFGALHWLALTGLLTAIPLANKYKVMKPVNPSEAYLPLMKGALDAVLSCGLVMIASLLIQAWFL
ncbi:ubiquinone biosynthesis protein UbiA [Paenibacillus swuensis]|uniref:Ubiquinone biosynthesis protein UbiA n=1 Tax=Paenibacillus swuensis TaxID=1178515 RepID=A0A172TK33_9BACL|nr:prenyltransferase [Paenibacillus swuensis]ANE47274.1 ubiquinone biosynthesis protein UbiA [Paenibacillus swuensis]